MNIRKHRFDMQGKRSYMAAFSLALLSVLFAKGILTEQEYLALLGILVGAAVAGLRSAIGRA